MDGSFFGRTPAMIRKILKKTALWSCIALLAVLAIPFGALLLAVYLLWTAADRLASWLGRYGGQK